MRFLSDEPIINIEELFFDFDRYGQEIAQVILDNNSEYPLTICINGPWGSGKTSLLRAVETYLNKREKCTTIFFDAWKYSKSESLYVALIKRIFAELSDINLIERIKTRHKDPTVKQYDLWRETFDIVGQLLDLEIDPEKYVKESSFRENIAFYDEFEKIFRIIINERINKGPFVILIDDLDRCTPSQTVDILEAIKLFLDIKGAVFLLAMDRSLIQASIHAYYKDITVEDFEKQYLDKLVHLNFDIPAINSDGLKAYIKQVLQTDDVVWGQIADECGVAMGGNPRRIKKFINQFGLIWGIIKDIGYTDKNGKMCNFNKRALIEWLLLRESSPLLIKDIQLRIDQNERSEFLREMISVGKSGDIKQIDEFIERNAVSVSAMDPCWNIFKYGQFSFYEDVSSYMQLGQRFPISPYELRASEQIGMNDDARMFGEKLREIRETRSISLEELAGLIELTGTVINLWEMGVRIPRRQTLLSLFGKLKLSEIEIDDLFSILKYPKLLEIEKSELEKNT